METMKRKWGKPVTEVQGFIPQEYCGNCLYPARFAINAPYVENGKADYWQITGELKDGVPGSNGWDGQDIPRGNDYIFYDSSITPMLIRGGELPNPSGDNNTNTYYMFTTTEECRFVRFTNIRRNAVEFSINLPAGTIIYKNDGAAQASVTQWTDYSEKNNS